MCVWVWESERMKKGLGAGGHLLVAHFEEFYVDKLKSDSCYAKNELDDNLGDLGAHLGTVDLLAIASLNQIDDVNDERCDRNHDEQHNAAQHKRPYLQEENWLEETNYWNLLQLK